uniref:TSA: Wollemia nobilis Ref_Wollemi_Transcript_22298_2134 transcribed RNA sequence n=1 Tax=Wollemia nobilis TaxID=56998 RepID=A0A0C9S4V0_9CONI
MFVFLSNPSHSRIHILQITCYCAAISVGFRTIMSVLGPWAWAIAATFGTLGIWIWIVKGKRSSVQITQGPRSWPLLGSILELSANFGRLYDWLTDYAMVVATFDTYLMGFRVLFTVDPANVEYILKTNFSNYVKGPAAHEVQYDLLGDGIFNSDGEMWRLQRKSASLEFSSKMLRIHSTETFRKYAVKLATVLQEQLGQKDSVVVNMQDMFMRMTFDSICELSFGVEIASLSCSLPNVPFASAFDRSNALCASRYFDPLWKLKKRLNLGSEAKLVQDVRVLDDFTYDLIRKRRNFIQQNAYKEVKSDLLSRFLFMAKENPEIYNDKKLRDAILNFVIAGRDTTAVTLSWLFWLLSKKSRSRTQNSERVRGDRSATGF